MRRGVLDPVHALTNRPMFCDGNRGSLHIYTVPSLREGLHCHLASLHHFKDSRPLLDIYTALNIIGSPVC